REGSGDFFRMGEGKAGGPCREVLCIEQWSWPVSGHRRRENPSSGGMRTRVERCAISIFLMKSKAIRLVPLVLALAFAGCTGKEEDEGKLSLAFVPNNAATFWTIAR